MMRAGEAGANGFTLVQALRGLAALWVVLFHVSVAGHIARLEAVLPQWVHSFLSAGHLGVAIFFALSGFVIAHSVRRAIVTPSYFGRFVLRRSIRLDPPYWASILFVVGMGILSARVKGEPFFLPSLPQVAAHIFYLQTMLGYQQINWVYWTLTYEVQFYLSLVLLIMFAQKTKVPVALVALVPFVPAVAAWLGAIDLPTGLFVDLWHAFLAGALAYWARTDRLALAMLALVCAISLALSPTDFTMISLATAVGLHLAFRQGYIYKGLDWRWLQFLGTISYSLYLVHNPVVGAVSFVSSSLFESDIAKLLLSVGASIAVASAFWYLFERPSLAFARHIRLKQAKPLASTNSCQVEPQQTIT